MIKFSPVLKVKCGENYPTDNYSSLFWAQINFCHTVSHANQNFWPFAA